MGDIIKFPSKKIVRKQPTPKQVESETKRKKAQENYFIEQLSEEIVLHMIHVFQDHAIKMKDDKFVEQIKERQYYRKPSEKRQERLKKRRLVIKRLTQASVEERNMTGIRRQH